MLRASRLALLLAAIAAMSVALVACGGDDDDENGGTAAEAIGLSGEDTTLALEPATARVLKRNEVTVEPIEPAEAGNEGISFPITGGEVEAETLAGTIEHSGGLRFSVGNTDVALTDFVVDTVAGTLTATTSDGAELPTLDLDLAQVEQSMEGEVIVASGITATLTRDAAEALNSAFDVEIFERGLPIGDVTVRASG